MGVNLELLQCAPLSQKKGGGSLGRKKIKVRDLIQLFIHLEQMQSAGVPMLESLADIRDTTDHPTLRDIMSDIHRSVSEGSPFSEAMALHPKAFNSLHVSLVSAGEETGDLTSSYKQLIKYLKWIDYMQGKIRKATRYPMILIVVIVLTITVMMGFVVPQIVGFIRNMHMELPWYTTSLIATSDFFASYWYLVLSLPVIFFFAVKTMRKSSDKFAYKWDYYMLRAPIFGSLIRKTNIARFCQTFGAMFASGIDILKAIRNARLTVSNRALIEALEGIENQIRNGEPLSQAFNASGEFPSLVVRMLKVGEESGKLEPVLDQISDFYTADVDEAVQGMIAMIEPSLTGLLGGMILWIAAAVFGPIYSSFEHIDT